MGDLAHARKLISTIVYQLATASTALRNQVVAVLKDDPSLVHASLRDQYDKLLIEPIRKLQCSPPSISFTLVIDALDECEEQQDVRLLLSLLAKTDQISSLGIRIFVTSRPEIPIRLGFRDMPSILYENLVLHNEPRQVVDRDIRIFVSNELEKTRKDHAIQTPLARK
jgi:hypothetical protein